MEGTEKVIEGHEDGEFEFNLAWKKLWRGVVKLEAAVKAMTVKILLENAKPLDLRVASVVWFVCSVYTRKKCEDFIKVLTDYVYENGDYT